MNIRNISVEFGNAKQDAYNMPKSHINKNNSVVTRAGIFEYLENGKIIKEYRPEQEVFKEESLKSLNGIPIIDNHPEGSLYDANNPPDNTLLGSVISEGKRQGENVVANLIFYNTKPLETKKELSLGYLCNTIDEQGEYNGQRYDRIQTDIKYNHLSLVEKGRAGTSKVDSILNKKNMEELLERVSALEEAITEIKESLKRLTEEQDDDPLCEEVEDDAKDSKEENIKRNDNALNISEAEAIVVATQYAKNLGIKVDANDTIGILKSKIVKNKYPSVKIDNAQAVDVLFDVFVEDEKARSTALEKQSRTKSDAKNILTMSEILKNI